MDKPKLLIIDDDKALCESLRDTIELEGYSVDTSYSAENGTKKVESNFYNIILLDMRLPDSDGITVLEKIKEISPDTEVIIFTAYAEMDIVIKAMDRNAFSFLPKPFETPVLITTIKKASEKQTITLENKRLLSHLKALNKVSQIVSESLDIKKTLMKVLEEVLTITRLNIGIICEYSGGNHNTIVSMGLSQKFLQEVSGKLREDTLCGYTFGINERVAIEENLANYVIKESLLNESAAEVAAQIITREGLESYFGFPIRFKQKIVAVLSLFNSRPRKLSPEALELITSICNQLGSSIENHKLFQKVCDSKRDWEDTFDTISDLISIHDRDFNIIRCNKAAVYKLNIEPENIIGRKCYEVFHDRNEPWPTCPFVRCKETLKVETEEKEWMGGAFLISCFPRFNEAGKFNGVVHIAKDITERKNAEDLITSLGRILEDSLNEIYIFDSETLKFIQVNKGARNNLGYSMKELLNFTPLDLKTEFTKEYFEKLIEPLRTHKKELIVFETVHRRKDGSTYDVEVHLQLSTYQSRPAFVAIILDITEHKKAEEALRQYVRELSALNKMSQQVSSSLSLDHVVQTALDGIIDTVNPALTLLFLRDGDKLNLQGVGPVNSKYSHDETPVHRVGECLCGLAVSERTPIYSSDILNDPRCTWKECKRAGLRSFAALPLFSGDEIIGVLGIAFSTLHDFENQTAFLQTLSNDISMGLQNSLLHIQVLRHSKELESKVEERTKELNRANIQLKELDNLKSLFIASMSHELRTPLNSIIGFTGIILHGMVGEISDEQRKQLTMVKNSGSYLLSLINDIIDISKIEAGKTEVYIRKFDLLPIVKDVINSFSVDVDEKGIKIDIDMPERIIVESDERRLRQILVNLVGNAVKFTDSGSVSVRTRKISDSTIEITVADTGIGLYLSKKISDLLGAEIKAESEFGKGSVFTVVLPLARTLTDTEK